MKPFRFRFKNFFYAMELLDEKGRDVFDLQDAIRAAESLYGDEWTEVYNGDVGAVREDLCESN